MMQDVARVSVTDMAMARDRRFAEQRRLLLAHGAPVISFTMNIAGPVKTSPLIRRGFSEGCERLDYRLRCMGARVLERVDFGGATGPERILCVAADAGALKAAAVRLEEDGPVGRLYDIDVLDEGGEKIERASHRRCLLCGRDAFLCARSRRHSASELFREAERLLRDHFLAAAARDTGVLAARALLCELLTTPKPGLVDRANNGSHRDMDTFTFAASAAALEPYFARCADEGARAEEPGPMLLERLREAGMDAELEMLRATGGVNTHKGAIFSLGILCAAAGWLLARGESAAPRETCDVCVGIVKETLEREMDAIRARRDGTAGERMLRETGMTGVRGEAMRGYPTAREGLRTLEAALDAGHCANDAGVAALLTILTRAEDSNFVKRASRERWEEWREKIAEMTGDPVAVASQLDAAFIRENISPGGSADLLAVAHFLHGARSLEPVLPRTPPLPG